MNYIMEINRFYDWLETNNIPKSAIALWHGLMHINNKANWIYEFTVAMSVLELKTGFKSSELYKARNELQNRGRIIWTSREGSQSAIYRIIPFCLHNMETNDDINRNINRETNGNTNSRQTDSINKLNQTIKNSSSDDVDLLKNGIPPNDSISRNWIGLREHLIKMSPTKEQANEIIRLSNFGEKNKLIWKLFTDIRNSNGGIKQPVLFLLKRLKE